MMKYDIFKGLLFCGCMVSALDSEGMQTVQQSQGMSVVNQEALISQKAQAQQRIDRMDEPLRRNQANYEGTQMEEENVEKQSMQKSVRVTHPNFASYADCLHVMEPTDDSYTTSWVNSKIANLKEQLAKGELDNERYSSILSLVMNISPLSPVEYKSVLNKIFAASVLHLLSNEIYRGIGSSFCPSEDDLQGIKINGNQLTPDQYIEIMRDLDERLENGMLEKGGFQEVVRGVLNIG